MENMFGDYKVQDKVLIDEYKFIPSFLKKDADMRILLDVGPANAHVSSYYDELNWHIYSFDPVSDNCTAINSMRSYEYGSCYDLANFTNKNDIKQIDLLRIDTEAYIFNALKEFPWDEIRPHVILCKYENKKTLEIDHTSIDLADFLLGKGYTVYVSQWYPTTRDNAQPAFMCLKAYPCSINNNTCGYLIALKEDIGFEAMKSIYLNQVGYAPGTKKRLFFISGPAQALNVMSIIHEEDIGTQDIFDIAIIGGLAVAVAQNNKIVETTQKIINNHKWGRIINITAQEKELSSLYTNRFFKRCEEMIYRIIETEYVDEVYAIRNSSSQIATMICRAYAGMAKIVIYGDAFGIVDSAIGHGHSKIDEIRVFMPIEYNKGFLSHIPLRIMKKATLLSVIDSMLAHDSILEKAILKLKKQADENSVLLTTVQFAEWNMMLLNHEVDMYIKAVERNAKPGDKVFIKEHPRVLMKKRVEMIVNLLTEKGYTCIPIDDEELRLIPVEVICRNIPFKILISTASSAGLAVKYLYGSAVDLGVDEDDLNNFIRGDYLKIFINGMRKALRRLDTWNGRSLLYSFDVSPLHYRESPSNDKILSTDIVLNWLREECYEKGLRFGDLLRKRGLYCVALYGIGVVGKRIASEIFADKDIALYLVDTQLAGQKYMSLNIYTLKQLTQPVDAVIITTIGYYSILEIKELLNSQPINAKEILTLHDFITANHR